MAYTNANITETSWAEMSDEPDWDTLPFAPMDVSDPSENESDEELQRTLTISVPVEDTKSPPEKLLTKTQLGYRKKKDRRKKRPPRHYCL